MQARRYLVVLLLSAAAAAQTAGDWSPVAALTPGTEVRITAASRTLKGRVARATADLLVLNGGKGEESFDRQQVSEVAVKRSGHRKRNILIGAAVGAGASVGIGAAARTKSGQLEVVPNSAIVAGLTVAGALAGTLVGALLPTGGWHEIYRR